MEKKKGRYLGTSIDHKWWKRFTEDGYFARGSGEYWFDEENFYFLRYLTQKPIVIPFQKVHDLQLGKWHCGTWAWGMPVVKFQWKRDQKDLSSGFVLAKEGSKTQQILSEINWSWDSSADILVPGK